MLAIVVVVAGVLVVLLVLVLVLGAPWVLAFPPSRLQLLLLLRQR